MLEYNKFEGDSYDLHKLLFSEESYSKYFEFCGVGVSRAVFKFFTKDSMKVVKLEYAVPLCLGILPDHLEGIITNDSSVPDTYRDYHEDEVDVNSGFIMQNKEELRAADRIKDDWYLSDITNIPIIDEDLTNLNLGILVMEYYSPISDLVVTDSELSDVINEDPLGLEGYKDADMTISDTVYRAYVHHKSDEFENHTNDLMEAFLSVSNDVSPGNLSYDPNIGFIFIDLGV